MKLSEAEMCHEVPSIDFEHTFECGFFSYCVSGAAMRGGKVHPQGGLPGIPDGCRGEKPGSVIESSIGERAHAESILDQGRVGGRRVCTIEQPALLAQLAALPRCRRRFQQGQHG